MNERQVTANDSLIEEKIWSVGFNKPTEIIRIHYNIKFFGCGAILFLIKNVSTTDEW